MNEISKPPKLTDDQLRRIAATLTRIRGGLKRANQRMAAEPAHIFIPSTADARHS